MIDCIRMRNFKCFDDASIPLNRLPVLAGFSAVGDKRWNTFTFESIAYEDSGTG